MDGTNTLSDPHHVVPAEAAGLRLVDHAREHLAVVGARRVGPLIAAGAVRIDGRPGRIAETLSGGERLTVDPSAIADLHTTGEATIPEDLAVAVVWEDDDLVVVDKPAGMHVHPMGPHRAGTLVGAMLWVAGARPDDPWAAWRPYPAHRLDRPTSGLLVFAKHREVQDAFRRLLDRQAVRRTYHALVTGHVDGDAGTVDAPLGPDPELDYRRSVVPESDGGARAVSHWRVVSRDDGRTRVEVLLETGRTHQIRAHLASLGHPIAGDTLYDRPAAAATSATAIALRAVRLTFPHPRTGATVDVTAPDRPLVDP